MNGDGPPGPHTPDRTYDVAVLGAGPAGLMAALALARAGRAVVVLEARDHPGGLAAGFEVGGIRVDHGSHRLHTATPAPLLTELRALLGDDLQRRVRRGRIRLGDRFLRFPLEPVDLLRHAPPRLALGAGRDLVTGPWRRPPAADTFADVVRSRLGPAVLEWFYRPYARKLWGREPEELSGALARRRIGLHSSGALVRRVLAGRDPDAGVYLYPRGGFGRIPEVLAEAARAAGADLRLGTPVTGLAPGVVITGDTRVRARLVASTLPLGTLATLGDAPPDLRRAAAGLARRGLVLCYLVVDRDRYTDWEAHYFPGPEIVAVRVTEPKAYRDDPGEAPGRTVLCAEIPASPGEDLWDVAPAALGARLARELVAVGLPDPEPREVVVRRVPGVYPAPRPGDEAVVGALTAWVTDALGVVPFGRHGMFVHDNTHHALAAGAALAACVGPDGFDRDAWHTARRHLEAQVVED